MAKFEVLAISDYVDKQSGETKQKFTKCGVAFPLRTGSGFSITFEALPVSGKCIIKEERERDDDWSPPKR